MPISPIVIQRRHAELGRIRLGQKGDRGQPQKLGAFRFTSPSQQYIADLAELYGGTPQPWNNNGKAEWEVFSTAVSIPVIAVKGGLSQWMETWSGGGCTHRCDGERQVDGTYCNPDDHAHQNARPTTRLSVMLPELDALGVFRMESHGWNAAAEIPAVAELAQYVGDLVPAVLHLVERRAIKDGKTSRFVVPILDLKIGAARLRELAEAMSSGRELGPSTTAPQLTAADPFAGYRERVEQADTLEDLSTLWAEAVEAHLVGKQATPTQAAADFTVAFKERAAVIQAGPGGQFAGAGGTVASAGEGAAVTSPSDAATSPTPDADGVVDAEIVPEPDAEKVWAEIVEVAGQVGMTLPEIQDDIVTLLGVSSAEASGGELASYLADNLRPRLAVAS